MENNLKSYEFTSELIKTDIISLDAILNGGITPGSIIQLVAEAGLGKSTICMHVSKNLCFQEKKILYIDVEGSISKELIESIDISENIDKEFFYMRGSTFGDVERIIDNAMSKVNFDLIIIDSIACLINNGFVDEKRSISIETNNSNLNSRPLTLFLNKYNAIAKSSKTSFILVNQFRNKVDMKVGTILKEFGGKNTRYNSDIILKIAPLKGTGYYKDFKDLTKNEFGLNLQFELIKSNKSAPGKVIPFFLKYGLGISNVFNMIYALKKDGIISEKNSYYQYKTEDCEKTFHGISELYNAFINELDYEEVMNKVITFYKK